MYSNSSDTIRDTLCYLMDEEKGHEIAFVQYPLSFENLTKNELYGGSLRVIREVNDINIPIMFDLFKMLLRAFNRFLLIDEDWF